MTRNIQKSYYLKIELSNLVACLFIILLTSTQTNACDFIRSLFCCCSSSKITDNVVSPAKLRTVSPALQKGVVQVISPLFEEPSSTHMRKIEGLDEAVDEDPTGRPKVRPQAPAESGPLTALIVDDQSVRLQERFLKQLGFKVTVLTSGADAIAFFNGGNVVDLVVIDYNMPLLTGFQTTQSIRTTHPDLSALFFLYSTEDEKTKRAALAAEFRDSNGIDRKLFDGQIPKPCTKQELEEVVAPHFHLGSKAK